LRPAAAAPRFLARMLWGDLRSSGRGLASSALDTDTRLA